MSIVTKRGDQGTTGLMYNRRVAKCDARVEAYGAVDELNAALGMARATAQHDFVRGHVSAIQEDLIRLMGELATAVEDLQRYVGDGYQLVTVDLTQRLDALVVEIENAKLPHSGWATPGSDAASAALDVARTVCRRAERRTCALEQAGRLQNPEILVYLNRLSDLLWLLARWTEAKRKADAGGASSPV